MLPILAMEEGPHAKSAPIATGLYHRKAQLRPMAGPRSGEAIPAALCVGVVERCHEPSIFGEVTAGCRCINAYRHPPIRVWSIQAAQAAAAAPRDSRL